MNASRWIITIRFELFALFTACSLHALFDAKGCYFMQVAASLLQDGRKLFLMLSH